MSATDVEVRASEREANQEAFATVTRPTFQWLAGLRLYVPSILAALNAVVFVLVRPDVNDLWAARARASAVNHGVGLFYWFGWFGGGSTPGNYSVLTPYLSAYLGTEVIGAVSAVAATLLITWLVRDLRHPVAASTVAAVAAATNLWSGRVPFLLGCAVGVAALIALRSRRRAPAVALTLLSILASPVSGAFIAMGLTGTFLTTRTKDWRPIVAATAGAATLGLVGVAVVFGTPGPEPFALGLALQLLAGLVLLRIADPPDWLRTTIAGTALAIVALWAIPNGMGSNFSRFVWFCLPVAVVATARSRLWVIALTVTPLLAIGASATLTDLRNAVRPVSSVAYYSSLAHRLDAIHDLSNYRVEVVNHGAHAGYDALLPHAALARGWETQEDLALNAPLNQDPLDATTYKVWLENNAVGYVALPAASVQSYPEYTLVQAHTPSYLHRVWSDTNWQLFRVSDPTPIVGRPATLLAHTQSSLTISVPCACTVGLRVRYSKFLDAALVQPPAPAGTVQKDVTGTLVDDGSGWTTITTAEPGTYRLTGSIAGLVR